MGADKPEINYDKVKAIRIEHGKSQDDLANLLGIQKSTYSRKENGHVTITLEEAKIISDYYNMYIEDIFFAPKVT